MTDTAPEIPPASPTPSDSPPEVKRLNAVHALLLTVLAEVGGLAAMAIVSFMYWHGKASSEVFLAVVVAPFVGPMIGKATGKHGKTTGALMLGIVGTAASRGGLGGWAAKLGALESLRRGIGG